MSYYDYLFNICEELSLVIEDLHFGEACARAESDDAAANRIAAEADKLSDISDSIWDKACRAAQYDA